MARCLTSALDPGAACSIHPADPRHAVAFLESGILTAVRCDNGSGATSSQHYYFCTTCTSGPIYQHRDVVTCALANESDVLFSNASSCTVCVVPLDADGADSLPVLAFATMPGASRCRASLRFWLNPKPRYISAALPCAAGAAT